MAHVADVIDSAGWRPDPLEPARERWWDEWRWTARVRDADRTEGLHWTPELVGLPRPAPVTPEPPILPPITADIPDTCGPEDPSDPEPAAFVPEAGIPGSRRRRLALVLGAAATAGLLGVGAAASAGAFRTSDQRPHLEPRLTYRDPAADFALRHPDDWQVLGRERGSSIRFAVAAPGATTAETNTVSVVVGTTAAAMPPLHTLAAQLTDTLRQSLPGVRLDTAARTRVAGAPGFRFDFRDPDATPATRIQQYVGRTADGRPLTVTVTVREPRTAPPEKELRELLASLRSGDLRARRSRISR